MHPNPVFRQEPPARLLGFARERGFGVFTAAGPRGVLAAHVPFVMEQGRVGAHLVRANPLAQHLLGGPAAALLIVSGPDSYISPDWYRAPGKLPTWNYVAVHIRGDLRRLDDDALPAHLDRLAQTFEDRLAPKAAWKTDRIDPLLLADLMRVIMPIELTVERVDGTFKLNQNRTADERAGAASALEAAAAPGMEHRALAALMRQVGGGGKS